MDRQTMIVGVVHSTRILNGLMEVRRFTSLCDGTVNLTDGTVKVSRALLAAGCPYFRTLFEFEQESNKGSLPLVETTLENVSCSTFECILDFIYTGQIDLDCDNIQDILQTSDLLLMTDLKELSMEYILSSLDEHNCLGVKLFAKQLACPRMMYAANQFTWQNFKKVIHTEEFKNLTEEDVKELLSTDGLAVDSEADILEALIIWLDSNSALQIDLRSLICSCQRSNGHPTFQAALNDVVAQHAQHSPWNTPAATRVTSVLMDNCEISGARERGMRTVIACYREELSIRLISMDVDTSHNIIMKELSPMLKQRTFAKIVAEGGYLFVIGETEEEVPEDGGERYDFSTNTWAPIAPLPHKLQHLSHSAMSSGSKHTSHNHLSQSDQYLHQTQQQYGRGKSLCPMEQDQGAQYRMHFPHMAKTPKNPFEPSYRTLKVIANAGKIYVFGVSTKESMCHLDEYDIYSNKWRSLPPVPNPRIDFDVAISNEKIFVVGGSIREECPRVLDTVEVFDIREQKWLPGPALKERRKLAVTVGHNNFVFVFGGQRPIECPSARGQMKVTGTEAILGSLQQGWLPLPDHVVPQKAIIVNKALAMPDGSIYLISMQHPEAKNAQLDLMIPFKSGWERKRKYDEYLVQVSESSDFCIYTLPAAAFSSLKLSALDFEG
ncbi:unnamed protein product [Meganyctiphanes norvegica]|uniref:Kelch-like protein diablo n=1 Tax=Meganyctiphanes norvegica TaxID=48144 RepID=A0AAV2S465_MEGNR